MSLITQINRHNADFVVVIQQKLAFVREIGGQ